MVGLPSPGRVPQLRNMHFRAGVSSLHVCIAGKHVDRLIVRKWAFSVSGGRYEAHEVVGLPVNLAVQNCVGKANISQSCVRDCAIGQRLSDRTTISPDKTEIAAK